LPTISNTFTGGATIGYKGGIRHKKVVGVADGVDATKVRGSDWHADHDNPAVYDYSEGTTSFTLAVAGVIQTRTVTLKEGTYHVLAHVRTSTMTIPGNPGTAILRKGGAQFGTQIDMRPTADAKFGLFGVFSHTGGSVTIDSYFNWEAGTTRFGVTGSTESRFAQKLLIMRIGD
jgi:hypothetical protein